MKNKILAMTAGPVLDQLIAQDVMKWQIYDYNKDYEANCYFMLVDENFEVVAQDYANPRNGERKTEEEAWKDNKAWSTDIAAACEMEEAVYAKAPEMGMWYAKALIEVFGMSDVRRLSHLAKLIRATPEQRAKAALLAVMGL